MNDLNDLVYNPVTGMFERAQGPTRRNPNVRLPMPPVIHSFQRRGDPKYGQKCKFVWEVSHATSLAISGLGALPATETGFCMIEMNDIYMEITLTASNSDGTVSRTLKVRPGGLESVPLPTINYFRKTGNGRRVGEEFVLEWDVVGAKEVTLSGPRIMRVRPQGTSHVDIEEQPRTYTLVAKNVVERSVSQTIVVEPGRPEVVTFGYQPEGELIPIGGKVKLCWNVEACQQVAVTGNGIRILSQDLRPQGTLEAIVTDGNPELTLQAINGCATSSAHLIVPTPEAKEPDITDFSFAPLQAPLFVGEKAILHWMTINAVDVQVRDGAQVLFNSSASGTREITVSRSPMTLTLVARNDRFASERQLTIEVKALPVIDSFSSDLTVCKPGDNITLNWATHDADRVTLNDTELPLTGTKQFAVAEGTTRLVLMAWSANRCVEKQLGVFAVDNPQPKIRYFRYPEGVDRHKGSTIPLEWKVENAQRVTLQFGKSKVEEHPVQGTRNFKVLYASCTIKLTAYNGPYTATKTLKIEREETIMGKLGKLFR